jgi:hypothetical protein
MLKNEIKFCLHNFPNQQRQNMNLIVKNDNSRKVLFFPSQIIFLAFVTITSNITHFHSHDKHDDQWVASLATQ